MTFDDPLRALADLSQEDRAALRDFVGCWEDHGGPVLFVGAGLSLNARLRSDAKPGATMKTWNDLVDALKTALSDGDDDIQRRLPGDFLRVAQLHEAAFGRARLLDAVQAAVPNDSFEPGPVHRELALIDWHAIVTTNYDDLIERAFRATGVPIRSVVADEHLAARSDGSDLVLLKLHGDLRDPGSIVLSEDDYLTYESTRPGLSLKARQLLVEFPVLFVGFSLSDPNFAKIDSWIRSSVGKFRVPALSISYGVPLPAERKLWAERGVTLVYGGVDQEAIFRAIRRERDRVRALAGSGAWDEIISHLKRVTAVRRERRKGWEREAKTELMAAIARAVGSPAAARLAERIAALVRQPIEDAIGRGGLPGDPDARFLSVFMQMDVKEQSRFLLFCARHGISVVWLSRDVRIEVYDQLLSKHQLDLSPDERADALVARGVRRRAEGRFDDARADFKAALGMAVERATLERIEIELRELLFAVGDTDGIRAELAKPDVLGDVFSMCRRAADFLLLDDRPSAREWYLRAETNARTGDEKSAALLGLIVCLNDNDARDALPGLERRRAQIPPDSKPRTQAVEELRKAAGRAALSKRFQDAVELLDSYILETRKLGWPQTAGQRFLGPADVAAKEMIALVLRSDEGEVAFERLQEAVAAAVRYGLPASAEILGNEEVVGIARTRTDRQWLREVLGKSGGLPGSNSARLLLRSGFLPYLTDAEIVSQVKAVCRLDGPSESLARHWELLRKYCEHLPKEAVVEVLSVAASALGNEYLAGQVRPARLQFSFWAEAGFLADSALDRLIAATIAVIKDSKDPYSTAMREALGLTEDLIDNGQLSSARRATLVSAASEKLGELLAREDEEIAGDVLSLGNIVFGENSASHWRNSFVAAMPRLWEQTARSNLFGQWVYAFAKILDDTERASLSEIHERLKEFVAASSRGEYDMFLPSARLAAMLLTAMPALGAPDSIVPTLRRLAEIDIAVLWDAPALPTAIALDIERAALRDSRPGVRERALGVLPRLVSVRFKDAQLPDDLVGELVAISKVGEVHERRLGLEALRRSVRDAVLNEDEMAAMETAVARWGLSDPDWEAQARAIRVATALVLKGRQASAFGAAIGTLARDSDVALVRRAAEMFEAMAVTGPSA